MSSEHVEVLERLQGVLEHGKMGDKCLIAPDLVTAAIAALSAPQSGDWVLVPREPTPEMLSAAGRLQACECGFVGDMSPMDGEEYAAMLAAAPQPPAEAQAVAKLVVEKDGLVKFIRPTGLGLDLPAGEYLLHLHPSPAEAQPVGAVRRDTGVTITLDRLPYYKGVRLASGTKLYAHPPPSAPVGVDTIRDGRAIVDEFLQCASIGRPHGKLIAQAKDWLADAEAALTKQPAAVDGDNPYPAPRNRQEAAALARLALAYLGVTSAHIDAVVARCETDLAGQQGGPQE